MPKENKTPQPVQVHFVASLVGITAAHPTRVALNKAAHHTKWFALFKDSIRNLHTGFGLNFARGTAAVTLQSWTKSQIYARYGNNTALGIFAGLSGAALAGSLVATFAETPFIRQSIRQKEHGLHLAFTRFSVPLLMLYLIREMGFSVAVFGSEDLPGYLKVPAFLGAATISAACHKLATWEATTDMSAALNQIGPNFKRDGVVKTLINLAYGNVYTLDACRVRFPNPVTNWQVARNFIGVTCPPLMIFTRILFLKTLEFGYGVGTRVAPEICQEISERRKLRL